jgi:acid phosphatase class B
MTQSYANIKNISSLNDILIYLKSIKNKDDVIVFFDWDDTLVNPDYDTIIEPQITKELFKYMLENKIHFSIITGRYYNTVCNDKKRDLVDMHRNIVDTIYPSLRKLGVDVDKYMTPFYEGYVNKIYDPYYICVGVLYMGIFFTGRKGETIKNYLEQTGISKKHIIFVDDYEPYLEEITSTIPTIEAYRRK